ncbi:hypothetical protein B0H65DRAFT_402600, partial [Neurospora tetraspora]
MATQNPKLGLAGAEKRRKRKARDEDTSDELGDDRTQVPKRVRTGGKPLGSLLRPYFYRSVDPGSARSMKFVWTSQNMQLALWCDGSHETRDNGGGFAVVHNRLKKGSPKEQGHVGRGWPATPTPSSTFTEALALAQ